MLTYVKAHWKEFLLFVIAGVVVAVVVSKIREQKVVKNENGEDVLVTSFKFKKD